VTQPWQIIESVDTDEGLLELRKRGQTDYLITIAGRVLMNSFANRSEKLLSELACNAICNRKAPKVLVGGLGMGYTLKAALDILPADAGVVVAELNPVVVKWCRGPLAHLTGSAVDDPRVTVKIDDVALCIENTALEGGDEKYDAIILDLYEGPFEAVKERYYHIYGNAALQRSISALAPEGVFAVWSEDPDRAFEKRLADAGFKFECRKSGKGTSRHVVYIARKSGQ
jgi:spermidine synthase